VRVIADLFERQIVEGGGEAADSTRPVVEVSRVYEAHAPFVWASLQRMGVRDADLDDVLQEVFVVVHQKSATFDGSSKMTTWLFGICLRVASAYRRRGFRRNETCVAEPGAEAPAVSASPEEAMANAQSRRRLDLLLDELDVDKRAVFVMFEIDEMPCDEIAQIVGVPVGTVYSRLHAARKDFQRALARMHARDARGRST
jgi:RNA polymerase sigma-70 factor, ECF subfamily